MNTFQIHTNPDVDSVFDHYPKGVRKKMLALRNLIIQTARDTEGLNQLEETLKWGEPAYLAKNGSTIRIDWKPKSPDQYAMYFQCTSRLVDVFRLVFKNIFHFEGNRAIIFPLEERVPADALKYCVRAALTYHKVKHLPTLGI